MNKGSMIIYILIGFISQMIDGTCGMGYGISATTYLTLVGVPAKLASASVHTAEIFTTLVSGISHCKVGNVDWKIFKCLSISGVIGAILGTFIILIFPENVMSVFSNIYLICIGGFVVFKVIRRIPRKELKIDKYFSIGLVGGFFDVAGGGWGPIVTSTIVASGGSPRYTIGSVNMAECLITIVQTIIFSTFIGIEKYADMIIGLAIGGVIAAPIAALLCKKIAERKMMLAVGMLTIFINIISLIT